jgi:hypothetical protein
VLASMVAVAIAKVTACTRHPGKVGGPQVRRKTAFGLGPLLQSLIQLSKKVHCHDGE